MAGWSLCWNPGGSNFPGRSSTIPAAASRRHRCAPSSILSARCAGGDFGKTSRCQLSCLLHDGSPVACDPFNRGNRWRKARLSHVFMSDLSNGPYEYLFQRQCVRNFNGSSFPAVMGRFNEQGRRNLSNCVRAGSRRPARHRPDTDRCDRLFFNTRASCGHAGASSATSSWR